MRFKTVPKPPDDTPNDALAPLASVREALPRVPRPESDCCGRIADRVAWIDDRATARDWLLFLRALGLATRTDDGSYVRADASLDLEAPAGRRTFAARFAEHVFLAEAVREQLADDPAAPATVFEDVREEIPEWERRRSDEWERVWTERVGWLLEWWVRFGDARVVDSGYERSLLSS